MERTLALSCVLSFFFHSLLFLYFFTDLTILYGFLKQALFASNRFILSRTWSWLSWFSTFRLAASGFSTSRLFWVQKSFAVKSRHLMWFFVQNKLFRGGTCDKFFYWGTTEQSLAGLIDFGFKKFPPWTQVILRRNRSHKFLLMQLLL